MKFALFLGCKIPFYLKEYELSTRAIADALDIQLIDVDFNCCGYSIRNYDFESYILSAARNLALSEQKDLNIITPCMCCFGSFKNAIYFLENNKTLKTKINEILQEENLTWTGKCEVKHILSVLYHDIGLDFIKKQIKEPNKNLKVAASYGCHGLRPSNVLRFDNALSPTIFENLVNITGAQSVSWSKRLDCCGNPLWGKNNSLSLDLMRKKLLSAKKSEADCICSACTYCQIQFDTVQSEEIIEKQDQIPSILFPQLLGLSMGISKKELGINYNKIKIPKIDIA